MDQKLDSDIGYEESFKFYLSLFNKYYADEAEYSLRKEIFYSNLLNCNAMMKMNKIDSMG